MPPVLDNGQYRALSRNVRAVFNASMAANPGAPWLSEFFQIIQSSTITETFQLLRGIPKMRKWVGDRQISGMTAVQFSITKEDWEATIAITKDDLKYDRLGLIRPNIEAFARSFPRHYVDFAVDLLNNGFSQTSYDGQYFFDTDHDGGNSTTYSNKSTAVFSVAEWETAESAPALLADPDSGEYLEVDWTHIVYGKGAQTAVDTVFNKSTVTGSAEANIHFNKIPKERQILLKGLGNSPRWFLLDLSKPIKPFILQVNAGVNFTAFDQPTDWNVFNSKEIIYGIDSEDNATFGFWELAYGSTAGV